MLVDSLCSFVLLWKNPEKHESQLNPDEHTYSFNHDGIYVNDNIGYGIASVKPSNCSLTYCKGNEGNRSLIHISDKRNTGSSCIVGERGSKTINLTKGTSPALYNLSLNDNRFSKSNTLLYSISPKAKLLVLGKKIPEISLQSKLSKESDSLVYWEINSSPGNNVYSKNSGLTLKNSLEVVVNSPKITGNIKAGFVNQNGAIFITDSGTGIAIDPETSQTCSENITSINKTNPSKADLAKASCTLLITTSCPNFNREISASILIDIYRSWGINLKKLQTTCME